MYSCNPDQAARLCLQGGYSDERPDLAPLFRIWLALKRKIEREASMLPVDEAERAAALVRIGIFSRAQDHIIELAARLSSTSARNIREQLAAWRETAPETSASPDELAKLDAVALSTLLDLVGLNDEASPLVTRNLRYAIRQLS